MAASLAVDENNACILVADMDNKRIVILSRSLNCARDFNVMSAVGGVYWPSCLHFNESRGLLFVGESDDGQRRVLVFDNVTNITSPTVFSEFY